MRMRKRTCSPEPSLITTVKYQQAIYEIPWYQFIWGTAQIDFMFGSELHKHRSALRVACSLGVQIEKILYTSVTFEMTVRIGDMGV